MNEDDGIEVYVSLKHIITHPITTYIIVVTTLVKMLSKPIESNMIPIIKHNASILMTMMNEVFENVNATTGKYVPKMRKYIMS